eukprot:gnl/MRDRNA2_/MRDRNA2_86266_c2_seq12.p2 gnl/MRDRNA2_/MRDRNA2_86266_c2~~gnl/MRDRNA2_/MRDRNA2_86266_c2_seq12.p2  ORF type:complete len:113 (+),score=13.94 gnl/MRDRNA2_/MRDRNA2_86266_c2_seq12:976-1314(+)
MGDMSGTSTVMCNQYGKTALFFPKSCLGSKVQYCGQTSFLYSRSNYVEGTSQHQINFELCWRRSMARDVWNTYRHLQIVGELEIAMEIMLIKSFVVGYGRAASLKFKRAPIE